MYFKTISLLNIILFVSYLSSFSQQKGFQGGKMPSIGKLYGKIIDTKTKEPIEFASVALFNLSNDSAIAGVLTKPNGDFMLENLPLGTFKFRIQFLGYKTIDQKVTLNFNKLEQDMGDIKLLEDETVLQEATVIAEKSTVNLNIDKRIYNVEKDLSVRGGTALDAMKNVPGVSVDVDGNATMRNSTPQIYIDGRPSTLTLQQIPSDMIERIEVITNPSVKFEAASSGGILNIVMKKNTKPGYNGAINLGIGTLDRYNGMANINIKENPWNLSLLINYMTATNLTRGYTNRTNYNETSSIENFYNQTNQARNKNTNQTARIGLDYYINNRNTLSISQTAMLGSHRNFDEQKYELLNAIYQPFMYGNQNNFSESKYYNLTSQLAFKRTYPKAGKELTMDLTGNLNRSKNAYKYDYYDYLYNSNQINELLSYQTNEGAGTGNLFTFQMDYSNPINDSVKFEWGLRSNIKQSNTKNTTLNSVFGSSTAVKDSFLSNDYHIDDIVNAAYINYSNRIKTFSYQTGLRFEQSYYSGLISDKNQRFFYNYPSSTENILKSIFPGIYISKKLKNNQEWQINFSRKIDRPNFFQLMPFVFFADKQNYRIGNPQLTPEFRNIAETNYNKIFTNGNLLTSLYFRFIESPITNIAYPKENDSTVLINTFVNGDRSFNYGWENNLKWTFLKKLDVNLNVNIMFVSLKSTQQFGNSVTEGLMWNTKGTLNYKFPKDFTIQLNGNYDAPRIVINGRTKPNAFMDFSINKNIKKVIMLTASVNDVFNTKRLGTNYHTYLFDQSLSRRREARFFKFTLMVMFGKMDSSIFKKRKNMNSGGGGNQDGLDF